MGYDYSVEATPRELLEYETSDGDCPFREWLLRLKDVRARALIRKRLNRVRLGNLGDCKPVGNGVKELRIDHGPGYRVYFGEDGPRVVVLLVGGDKKSQDRDIVRAQVCWQDYLRS